MKMKIRKEDRWMTKEGRKGMTKAEFLKYLPKVDVGNCYDEDRYYTQVCRIQIARKNFVDSQIKNFELEKAKEAKSIPKFNVENAGKFRKPKKEPFRCLYYSDRNAWDRYLPSVDEQSYLLDVLSDAIDSYKDRLAKQSRQD